MYENELTTYLKIKENILSILGCIYGKAEEKTAKRKTDDVNAAVGYYEIGDKKPFVVTDEDVNKLCDLMLTYMKTVVSSMKSYKTEDELIDEYLEETEDEYLEETEGMENGGNFLKYW